MRADAPSPRPPESNPSGPTAGGRRACPRCGAVLGVLRADPAGPTPAAGSESVDAADSLYCGCCGLVVPATR